MAMTGQAEISARFNPLVRPYLVLQGALIMLGTLFLIPLVPFWLLGLGQWWAKHYYERLLCELGDTELRFRKGILFQVEKTIPLENIQDVTFIEGPLLRQFNLSTLKFETAGHSAGQANDMTLVGIVDAHDFRAEILRRRTALRQRLAGAGPAPVSDPDGAQLAVLQKISIQLERIAQQLEQRGPARAAGRASFLAPAAGATPAEAENPSGRGPG
jgi:membrane protein YdbS with pleckstrin-like domain